MYLIMWAESVTAGLSYLYFFSLMHLMNWSQCDCVCVCVCTSIFLITDWSSSLAKLCIYPLFSLYDHDQILWFAPSPQQQIPRVTFQQTSSSLFAGQTGCLHTRFSFIMMTSGEAYSQYLCHAHCCCSSTAVYLASCTSDTHSFISP